MCVYFARGTCPPTGLADVNIERMGYGVQRACAVSRGHVFRSGRKPGRPTNRGLESETLNMYAAAAPRGHGDHRAAYGATLGAT